MDVSFSNVLEGTRQYFQGLPSAAPGPGPGPVPGPGPGPGPGNAPPNQGTDPRNCTAVPYYGTVAGSRPTTLQSSSPTVATSPSILSWQSTPPPTSATVLNETTPLPPPTAPAPVPHRHNLPPIASLSTTFSRSAVQKLPPQRVRPRPLPTAQPPKIEAVPVQEPETSKPKDDILLSEPKSENELKLPENSKEEPLQSRERPSESGREIKEDQTAKTEESQRLDESEAQRLGTSILNDRDLEEKKIEPPIEILQFEEQNVQMTEMAEFRIQGVEIDRTDKDSGIQSLESQLPKITIFEGKESSQDISRSQEYAVNKASEVARQNESENVGIESVDASLAETRSVDSRIDVDLKEEIKSDSDMADPLRTGVSASDILQVEVRKAIIEQTDAANNDNVVHEVQAANTPCTQANSPERILLAEEIVAVSEEAQVNRPEEQRTEGGKHESRVSDEAQNNITDVQNADALVPDQQSTETQRSEMPTDETQLMDVQVEDADRLQIHRSAGRQFEMETTELQRTKALEMQTAEAQRAEMQRPEFQRAEDQKLEILRAEAYRTEMQRAEAYRIDMQSVDPHRIEMQRAGPHSSEFQRTDTQRFDIQTTDTQKYEMEGTESQRVEMPGVDDQRADLQMIEAQRAEVQRDAQKVEIQRIEAQRAEIDRIEAQTAEMQRMEAQRAEIQKAEAQRAEMQRVEAQRAEMHRFEAQRAEMQRFEAQRAEMQRFEAQRAEMQRVEVQRAEMQRAEAQRAEMQRAEAQRAEMQRAEAQRAEMQRVQTQRAEMQRAQAQRVEMQRVEVQRAEMQRVGAQRAEIQRVGAQRAEMQRVEAQRAEMQRAEAQRAEMQRVEAQRAEMQRVEAQRAEMQRVGAQRAEMQRIEAQRADMQRVEAPRADMQRVEAQRADMQRVEAQRADMQRVEAQRADMQRVESQRADMQRVESQRADMQRIEAQRADMHRAEAQRVDMQRVDAQRADTQRIEAQRADMQRVEAQRVQMQRAEAQRAEVQRVEAQRVEIHRFEAQRAEAQRVEMQRLEAQRADMQRAEAHRVEMQRAEAHRAEMQRLEGQRADIHRLETSRGDVQITEAQRAEMHRAEAQQVELQRLQAQRTEAYRAELSRNETHKAEVQRVEALRMDAHRTDQRAEHHRAELQNLEVRRDAEKINERRQDAIRYDASKQQSQMYARQHEREMEIQSRSQEVQRVYQPRQQSIVVPSPHPVAESPRHRPQPSPVHTLMSPWPQQPSPVPALLPPRHQPAPSPRLENASPHNTAGATYVSSASASYHQPHLVSPQSQRTAPSPYHHASPSPHNLTPSPHQAVPSHHNSPSPHHPTPSPRHATPSPHHGTPSPHHRVSPHHTAAPQQQTLHHAPAHHGAAYSKAVPPTHHVVQSSHHTASSPSQPCATSHHVHSAPAPYPSAQAQNHSAPSPHHAATPPHNVASTQHYTPSPYHYASPSSQQTTTGMQHAAPLQRHSAYHQPQMSAGPSHHSSQYGTAPHHGTTSSQHAPTHHVVPTSHHLVHPSHYASVPPQASAEPSQQHTTSHHPEHPAALTPHHFTMPPSPRPSQSVPEHPPSSSVYMSSRQQTPYRPATTAYQQSRQTSPALSGQPVRLPAQPQAPPNSTYRHVQPVSNRQPHPAAVTASTSYRTPSSPYSSQHSSSSNQPAAYPQQYQQRLVAPSSQQYYHSYNAAAPQRHEALPPVSQIKGVPQQNGGYPEVESQPTRLPPVSSFRSVDPARHGQQVYLPTSVASTRVTSVAASMPPPPAPNVQQVARTSTPMPPKQYAFTGYPQAQAKQVSHTPDALGKARLHAEQQSGAPAAAASTSTKGSAPQQGSTQYPTRPLATAMDASPSPVLPNGHLPLGVRRESPLDLSVKTVRQSADSTAADDSEVMAILDKSFREPPAATVPKVDFTPNFGAAAVHQHRRPSVNHYPQPAQLPQPPKSPVVWPVPSSHSGVPSFAQTHQNYPQMAGMKRPSAEPPGPVAPPKAPCVDSWRATIDMHIEERLSKAEAQQRELKRREQVQHESVIHHAPPVPHFGGADRRTLSILRNSLEERELQRAGGVPGVPPGFSAAPGQPQIKLSVPRAIDSVPPGSDLPNEADRMAAHADQDGAAAMAAMARIRTKAELKQWTGPLSTTVVNSQVSAGQSLYPLLPKDRALLCMNKGAPTHTDGIPKMARGVFDFPDSNSDGEMPVLERQPLRHEKRLHYAAGRLETVGQENSVPSTSNVDSVKVVEKTETTEPEDPFWMSACDNFMAQLETGKTQGNLRRKNAGGGRRKKAVSPAPNKEKNLADLPSSEKAPATPSVVEATVLPMSPTPSTSAPTPAPAAPAASKPALKATAPTTPATITQPVKAKARVGRPPKNRLATPAVTKEPVKRRGRLPRSAVQSASRVHSESSDREVSPTPSEDHKPLSQLTKIKTPKVERMGTRSSGSVRATRSGSTLKTPPKVTRSSARNLTPEKKMSVRVTRMSKTSPVSEEKNEVKKSRIMTRKELQVKRQIKQEVESSDEDLPLVRKKEATPPKAEVKAEPKKVKAEPKKESWSESSSSDSDDSDETVETVAQRLRTRNVKRKAKDDCIPEKLATDGGSADASKTSPPKQKNKKKLPFGEGSDFRPGWEDELTKYKRSLRMPPLLINLSRAGSSSQQSTSLPDLDTGPNSPALSGATDNADWNTPQRNVDLIDSDLDSASNCPGMDSDATSSSVISTSTIRKRNPRSSQLLDQLVEKVVNRGGSVKAGTRKELKKESTASPLRAIRRNALKGPEALPTPGVFQYQAFNNNKPITNFRDAFRANGMLQLEDKAKGVRGRGSKPTSNIRAVFGEDHPNEESSMIDEERKSVQETKKVEKRETQAKKEKMRAKIERRRDGLRRQDKKGSVGVVLRPRRGNGAAAGGRPGLRSAALVRRSKAVLNSKQMLQRRKRRDTILATTPSTSTEMQPQTFLRRKMKLRRKFRSGFDYIRKKKRQIKKDEIDSNKDKKKCIIVRPNPESEEDIQAEIRNWVMKKGLGETILHRAAKLGFADVTAFCLEKMDFSPSARDNAGYTPLHVACSRGHTDIAHLLLLYGANVSDSVLGGIRPLHEAAERNHVEMLRLLLSYGADPLLATYSGQTALSLTSPDSDASRLLQNHLRDVQGLTSQKWFFAGPATCFDTCPLVDDPAVYPAPPSPVAGNDLSDFEVEMSDTPILPLYQLLSEPSERYVLLNELLTALRIKSKRTFFKLLDGEVSKNEVCNDSNETCSASRSSSGTCNSGSDSEGNDSRRAGLRVLSVAEFTDQVRCCDFLSASDKVSPKWKKIELICYNDRVKQLLGVQMVRIPVR